MDSGKEEEGGEGLLSRAGRYAPKHGSVEADMSSESETKASQKEDVENETERALNVPPSLPEAGGRRERRGLLRRAQAASEERPKSKRQSRRERRKAEREASGASASHEAAPEEAIVSETPAAGSAEQTAAQEPDFDLVFQKEKAVEMPQEETFAVGISDSGELSPDTSQREPSGLPETEPAGEEVPDLGLPETAPAGAELSDLGLTDTAPAADTAENVGLEMTSQEEEVAAGGETPGVPSTGLEGESPEAPAADLANEFPAELDFGEESVPTAGEEASEEAAGEEAAPKPKKGLLAMASLLADKEKSKKGKARRARAAARKAAASGSGGSRKAPAAYAEKETEAKEAPLGEEAAEEEAVTPREEAAVQEATGLLGEGFAAEMKDFASSLETYLSNRDALSALDLFNESVAREGHTSFILRILETMTNIGKGKTGLLFTPSGDRYAVEFRVPPGEKTTRQKNPSFGRDSRFVQALRESWRGFLSPGSRKGETLKRETSPLGSLSPWIAVPLTVGNELVAFVVIGRRPDRPKTDEEAIALLARLSAPYINKYLLLKERRLTVSALEREVKTRDSVYSLYYAFENLREKFELPERCVRVLLEGVSANLGITSAAVLADWKPKTASGVRAQGIGNYVPVASVGVPERALSRCKVSAKDPEIRAIMEACRPSVPNDAAKRMEALARYASSETTGAEIEAGAAPKWPRSFAAAPLLFNGEPLGLLVVYDMKGAGKALPQEASERLRHASRVLVPALLYGKLHVMSPFDLLRWLVASRLDEARRNRTTLAVAVFTVENAKRACGELGFSAYWGVFEKLGRLIEAAAGERGVVEHIDWNRLALFYPEHGENEVDDVIARVRTGFAGGLKKKERESGISIATKMTRYPRESKSVEDILISIM